MATLAAGSTVLVVNFHGLGAMPDHVDSGEARVWCTDPGRFGAILDSIATVERDHGLPVRITFDDGNASDHAIALPMLADRGLSAEFFICAGRIGAPHYLGTSQIAEMLAVGMRFGSHGWSHINWRTADDAVLAQEIDDAHVRIEAAVGRPIDMVAIPFGRYDRRVLGRLGRYTILYNSDGGLARAGARHQARNSFTTDWTERSLIDLAAGRCLARQLRRDLISLVKRWR
ncbi:MAG: polysaccharide deacetylase family protein [Sphingomonadales bacterium]